MSGYAFHCRRAELASAKLKYATESSSRHGPSGPSSVHLAMRERPSKSARLAFSTLRLGFFFSLTARSVSCDTHLPLFISSSRRCPSSCRRCSSRRSSTAERTDGAH